LSDVAVSLQKPAFIQHLRQKPLKLTSFHKIYEQISTTLLSRQTNCYQKKVGEKMEKKPHPPKKESRKETVFFPRV
jgi:hypothetical protein